MSQKIFLSHGDCRRGALVLARDWACRHPNQEQLSILPVPRGGVPAAYLVASAFADCGVEATVMEDPARADLIVDDIVDSGKTKARYQAQHPNIPFLALTDFMVVKPEGCWFVFPWEVNENQEDTSANDCVVRLLERIGEDPNREGLKDTPRRVLKAWDEMTIGYKQDPKAILARTFQAESYDEMIVCTNIEFYSTCEHHLLPFFGKAHVGYLPQVHKERVVVGLSKLARLVDCFSRRLQIQERMTIQIADAMESHLNPQGVGVVIEAKHLCMACRGVQKHQSSMITSAMRGVFRSSDKVRQEFLGHAK